MFRSAAASLVSTASGGPASSPASSPAPSTPSSPSAPSSPLPLTSERVQQSTGRAADWLGTHWIGWLEGLGQILVIVAVALVLRVLVRRLISKVTAGAARGARGPAAARATAGPAPAGAGSGLLIANALGAGSERRRQRAEAIGSVLRSVSSFVIMGICALTVLSVLHIDLAPLLASAGVAGVAVGFGARNLVTDFLSGVFMILEDQYGVGDVIDAGVASGEVVEVGLRVTKLRGAHGEVWYVRNGEIKRIGNMSQGWATAVVDVRVSAAESLRRVREVITATAEEMAAEQPWDEHLWEAVELLGVTDVTADTVTLQLQARTMPGREGPVARELRARIKEAFDAAGIGATTPVGAPAADGAEAVPVPAQPEAAAPSAHANPSSPQYRTAQPLDKPPEQGG